MAQTTRILAIHAHPDDIEFQCAGTLALLRQRGHSVTIATMTPGDCGSAEMSAEEISAVRRAEAQRSAESIGAEYFCLEFRDLMFVFDNDTRRRVAEFLRQVQPDVILAAPPIDYMTDHEMTSELVRDASFSAPIPNYATGADAPAPALAKVPYLYYMDSVEGTDHYGNRRPAGFLVDTSAVFETKRQMLACHESQRNWLLRQHGIDEYLDTQARWSRARGTELGVEHAEAFWQHCGHPYPHDNLLAELVGTS